MTMFLTAALVIVFCYLTVRHVIGIIRSEVYVEEGGWCIPTVLSVAAASFVCSLVAGDSVRYMAAFYVLSCSCAIFPHTSILYSQRRRITISVIVISVDIILDGVLVLQYFRLLHLLSFRWISWCIPIMACFIAFTVIEAVYARFKDIKAVMKSGTVWTVLCLSVDYVYMIIMLVSTFVLSERFPWLYAVLMSGLVAAMNYRVINSSVFILMVEKERKIVESMRLSRLDGGMDSMGVDQLYANIYERVLRYFENDRPYLNNELTINDIVGVVFTNKLYISKAISFHTGRNFCQFVNYYRISYAVEIFRDNPQLKVVEMASRSGFNSTTSFNAAFRLYMGDKPSEWCRKERARLTKRKTRG